MFLPLSLRLSLRLSERSLRITRGRNNQFLVGRTDGRTDGRSERRTENLLYGTLRTAQITKVTIYLKKKWRAKNLLYRRYPLNRQKIYCTVLYVRHKSQKLLSTVEHAAEATSHDMISPNRVANCRAGAK